MKKIIEAMEKAKKEFGSHGDIILTREAYDACNPNAPQTWHCTAVRVVGQVGQVSPLGPFGQTVQIVYDFEWMDKEIYDAVEDASDYPWDEAVCDFVVNEEYDLTDSQERAEFLTHI